MGTPWQLGYDMAMSAQKYVGSNSHQLYPNYSFQLPIKQKTYKPFNSTTTLTSDKYLLIFILITRTVILCSDRTSPYFLSATK